MSELYSDDYSSVADDGTDRLIPESLRRLTGAVVFVGLIAGMGTWAYRLGTRDAAELPIIRAMDGPARIQPEDPGGARAAHQGLEVNAVLAGQPAPVPRAAPAGVALETRDALAEEDVPLAELVVSAMPETIPGPATELRVPPEEDMTDPLIQPAPDLRPVGEETDIAAESEVEIAPVAGPRPRSRPSNLVVARAPAPAAAKPAPQAEAQTQTPAPATATPAVREVSQPGTGTRLVQLGAFDSADITRQAWARLVARNGDLLGSKSLYVERTTANARVFYRLRVAGFANTDETRTMCEALRARGVDCIPVTLQ